MQQKMQQQLLSPSLLDEDLNFVDYIELNKIKKKKKWQLKFGKEIKCKEK